MPNRPVPRVKGPLPMGTARLKVGVHSASTSTKESTAWWSGSSIWLSALYRLASTEIARPDRRTFMALAMSGTGRSRRHYWLSSCWGPGLFVTLRLAFIQVRGFKHAVAIATGQLRQPRG